MTLNLCADMEQGHMWHEKLCTGAVVRRGFAVPDATAIFAALHGITTQAPFRHMVTPGGFRMSVAMTNCGAYGWVTDRRGYRYDVVDPETGKPWPRMPGAFPKEVPIGSLPAASGKTIRFTRTTVFRFKDGKIAGEIDGEGAATALSQLGLVPTVDEQHARSVAAT